MEEGRKFPDVIYLDVGGTHITTSLSTLTKFRDSKLAAMFFGRQPPPPTDSQGRYFIDCDGETFKLILEYLRFGLLPPASSASNVYEYAKHFGLYNLIAALKTFNTIANIKEKLKISGCLTVYENIKCDVMSNVYNEYFSTITLYLANEPSPTHPSCYHSCDRQLSFLYLSKNIHKLDWIKALHYELDTEAIKCRIFEKNASRCKICQMSFNSIVCVSFNDCTD